MGACKWCLAGRVVPGNGDLDARVSAPHPILSNLTGNNASSLIGFPNVLGVRPSLLALLLEERLHQVQPLCQYLTLGGNQPRAEGGAGTFCRRDW